MTATHPLAGVPDSIVRQVDSLPEHLEGTERIGLHAIARPGTLLLNVPGVARYLVRDGASIEYFVEPGGDPAAVQLFLNGAARAALLHQRGDLPLHGAGLLRPGGTRALVLCGHSGAGKSTLALELSRRGWQFLADDTTRVTWQNSTPMAWPSNGLVKIWQDACDAFAIPSSSLPRVRQEMEKFYVALPAVQEPVSLTLVFELVPAHGALEEVTAIAEKMRLLSEHTFRPRQIRPLGCMEQHLRIVANIAGACEFVKLYGARLLPVAKLADHVEEAAQCRGL